MNELNDNFMNRLLNTRAELERDFDEEPLSNPKMWEGVLELLYDHLQLECSALNAEDMKAYLLFTYKTSFFTLSCQFLLSSYYLVRTGVRSPAFAALRSALEHFLAWKLLRREPALLRRSWIYSLHPYEFSRYDEGKHLMTVTDNDRDLVEGARKWHRYNVWENQKHYVTDVIEKLKFVELVASEESFWFRHGIHSFYRVLCNHIHIGPNVHSTATRCVRDSHDIPSRAFELFGGHLDEEEIMELHIMWRRVALCILEEAAKHDSHLSEQLQDRYNAPSKTTCKTNLEDVASRMWRWDRFQSPQMTHMLIVPTGRIEQKKFAPSDQRETHSMQIPLCKRDETIALWRKNDRIPIPYLSPKMKWELLDSLSKELGTGKQKEYEKLRKEDESSSEKKEKFTIWKAEEFILDELPEERVGNMKLYIARQWLAIFNIEVKE